MVSTSHNAGLAYEVKLNSRKARPALKSNYKRQKKLAAEKITRAIEQMEAEEKAREAESKTGAGNESTAGYESTAGSELKAGS